MPFMVNKQILWLYIPIYDVQRMHMGDGKNDLDYEEESNIVNEVLLWPKESEDLTTTDILKDEVNMGFGLECSVSRSEGITVWWWKGGPVWTVFSSRLEYVQFTSVLSFRSF